MKLYALIILALVCVGRVAAGDEMRAQFRFVEAVSGKPVTNSVVRIMTDVVDHDYTRYPDEYLRAKCKTDTNGVADIDLAMLTSREQVIPEGEYLFQLDKYCMCGFLFRSTPGRLLLDGVPPGNLRITRCGSEAGTVVGNDVYDLALRKAYYKELMESAVTTNNLTNVTVVLWRLQAEPPGGGDGEPAPQP